MKINIRIILTGLLFVSLAFSGGLSKAEKAIQTYIDKHVEDKMRNVLKEIQSGQFHEEWQKEAEDGFPALSKLRKEEKKLPIEEVGQHILKELFKNK